MTIFDKTALFFDKTTLKTLFFYKAIHLLPYQLIDFIYTLSLKGDRITKKSKYIPQTMRSQIEKMNNEKAPVEEILKVLRSRSKKHQYQ